MPLYDISLETPALKGEIRERWQQLCEQAAEEQDTDRLIELTAEINRLLAEKELRLKSGKSGREAP
jgi:hypothetical protein